MTAATTTTTPAESSLRRGRRKAPPIKLDNVKDPDERARLVRLSKNRKAAEECRERRKMRERQLQMHVEELKTRNAHLQEQLRATAADLHNLRKALGCLGPTQSRSMLPVSSAFAMHLPPPHAFATCANVAPTTWSASDSEATLASSSLSSVHNSPPPSDSQLLSMLLEAAVLNALQCPSAAVPTLLPHQRL